MAYFPSCCSWIRSLAFIGWLMSTLQAKISPSANFSHCYCCWEGEEERDSSVFVGSESRAGLRRRRCLEVIVDDRRDCHQKTACDLLVIAERGEAEEVLYDGRKEYGSTVQNASFVENWPVGHILGHDHCSFVDLKSLIIIQTFLTLLFW